MTAVTWIHDGTAAGCKNNAVHGRQVVDDLGFTLAESLFTLFLKNKGYVDACARLDLLIAVNERQVQEPRDLAADR